MIQVTRDGATVRIAAAQRIELRVRDAVIIMEKNGHIIIWGNYIVSHGSARVSSAAHQGSVTQMV